MKIAPLDAQHAMQPEVTAKLYQFWNLGIGTVRDTTERPKPAETESLKSAMANGYAVRARLQALRLVDHGLLNTGTRDGQALRTQCIRGLAGPVLPNNKP